MTRRFPFAHSDEYVYNSRRLMKPPMIMTDLPGLANRLKEQLVLIDDYLTKAKAPTPSFIPSETLLVNDLPSEIEEARENAQRLSWSIHQLLTSPAAQLRSAAVRVRSKVKRLYSIMIPWHSAL